MARRARVCVPRRDHHLSVAVNAITFALLPVALGVSLVEAPPRWARWGSITVLVASAAYSAYVLVREHSP